MADTERRRFAGRKPPSNTRTEPPGAIDAVSKMRRHVPPQSDSPAIATKEIKLFGYRLHPMKGDEVIDRIADAVRRRQRLILANLNLHGMAVMYDSPGMARLHAQPDCQVIIDGMPIVFLANLMLKANLERTKRTTSLDFYDDLFALANAEQWKIAYIGGRQWVIDAGLAKLQALHPQLQIQGRNGYFDITDFAPDSVHSEILDWLRDYSPDIVIVGMGMPRQEEWIEAVQRLIDARVFMPTGAYLDYQAGAQHAPPRWLGQYGLEWLYRLLRSPYRLAYRYLIEPFVLASRIVSKRPLPIMVKTPANED